MHHECIHLPSICQLHSPLEALAGLICRGMRINKTALEGFWRPSRAFSTFAGSCRPLVFVSFDRGLQNRYSGVQISPPPPNQPFGPRPALAAARLAGAVATLPT